MTCDVGENHIEFILFENQNIPSPSSALEEDVDFNEIGSFDGWWDDYAFAFEYVICLVLDYARVEFSASMPRSMIEDETHITNKVSMSDYCQFAQIVQFIHQINDIEHDFDLIDELRSGPSDRAHHKFIWYMD